MPDHFLDTSGVVKHYHPENGTAEIDRLWAALSEGGTVEQCGWLKDRYGVSWQIVPSVFGEMMKDKDRAKVRRVAQAMLKMVKFDIAELQKAYRGEAAA